MTTNAERPASPPTAAERAEWRKEAEHAAKTDGWLIGLHMVRLLDALADAERKAEWHRLSELGLRASVLGLREKLEAAERARTPATTAPSEDAASECKRLAHEYGEARAQDPASPGYDSPETIATRAALHAAIDALAARAPTVTAATEKVEMIRQTLTIARTGQWSSPSWLGTDWREQYIRDIGILLNEPAATAEPPAVAPGAEESWRQRAMQAERMERAARGEVAVLRADRDALDARLRDGSLYAMDGSWWCYCESGDVRHAIKGKTPLEAVRAAAARQPAATGPDADAPLA